MENKRPKVGSLFDGSGGFPLAGVICGMEPVWASEIEPYPLKVTAARFPQMKQLGDVTKITGSEIEAVDAITFGSPCQDLSIAGKQAGIHDGARSSLFFEAVRIIKEMRDNDPAAGRADKHPRFAVWENVPGAFSSNKGEDFRAVLQALAEVEGGTDIYVPMPEKGKWNKAGCIVGDGWSIAWRTYDAQYWGVPQRRKRIYLIADFGSERAGEILFERESVRWDPAQGRETGQGTSANAEGRAGGSAGNEQLICFKERAGKPGGGKGILINEDDHAFTLSTHVDEFICYQDERENVRWDPAQGREAGQGGENNQAGLIDVKNRTASPNGTNQAPATVYCLQGNGIDRALTAGCNGKGWRENESYTLNTIDRPAVVFESHPMDSRVKECGNISPTVTTKYAKGTADTPLIVTDCRGNGTGNIVPTLTGDHQRRVTDYTSVICGGNGQHGNATGKTVANTLRASASKSSSAVVLDRKRSDIYGQSETASTLCARDYKEATDLVCTKGTTTRRYIVRRLTPLECCRLQGFPDWWEDGVEGSDSARYKMWGNGIALPCAVDVLWRIAHATNG